MHCAGCFKNIGTHRFHWYAPITGRRLWSVLLAAVNHLARLRGEGVLRGSDPPMPCARSRIYVPDARHAIIAAAAAATPLRLGANGKRDQHTLGAAEQRLPRASGR